MIEELHFLRPWAFLAIAPAILLLWLIHRRQNVSRAWRGIVAPHLLPYLLSGTKRRGLSLPFALLAIAWIVGIVALAGPSWRPEPSPFADDIATIAIVSGIMYLLSSLAYSRITEGTAHAFALRHVLICLMLALTLVSQFWITPHMITLRAQVATFDTADTLNQPARVQFDALHAWSTRAEITVLLLGLVAIYLTASVFSRH